MFLTKLNERESIIKLKRKFSSGGQKSNFLSSNRVKARSLHHEDTRHFLEQKSQVERPRGGPGMQTDHRDLTEPGAAEKID